jgi:membrane protein DedA with SNARE-associated domain
MGHFFTIIHHVEPYIAAYGAAAVFLLVYFESFGVPLPGESGVVASALLAAHGDLSIATVFLAVFSAAVLGDSTGYVIGRVGGHKLLRRLGPRIRLTPERLDHFEKQLAARGASLVVVARFVPLLRQLNGLIAGAFEMPWHVFAVAQAIGALLWTTLWTLGPYFFGEAFRALG